jgi:hypothetical protein
MARHASAGAFAADSRMSTDADSALEGLARFVQTIGRDPALRQRFCRLANLSPVQRSNEIHIMAEQMAAEHKDPELVALFRLFADARVFEAAMLAMRECGYVKE